MADRYIVTTHLRRFQVDGEQAWIRAARAQAAADEARRRAAASVRGEMGRGSAAATRSTQTTERAGRSSRVAAGDVTRLAGAYGTLTAAQMRAATREGQLLERAMNSRRAALAQERAYIRQREALAARSAAISQRQAAAAAAPVARTRPAGGSFGISPGLIMGGVAGYGAYRVVDQAGQFEAATRDAAAFAGMNRREEAMLARIARATGLNKATGATEAARAAGELAKADIKLNKIAGTLNATLDLARAGDVDNREAAVAQARAMGVFNLGVSKAQHVADLLVGASNSTAADVHDFILAFQAGASNAKAIGQDIDEAVLSMVLQAKRGVQNSDAGTSLKTSIIQLARNPSDPQREILGRRRLNFFTKSGGLKDIADISQMLNDRYRDASPKTKTAEISKLVGTDGVRTLLAWMSFTEKEVEAIKKQITAEGQAKRAAAKRLQGYEGARNRLSAAGEEASIRLGTPFIGGLADVATSAVQALQTPGVQRALDRFGEEMGERGSKLAEGFAAAADDGRLEDTLDGVLAAASAVGDAGEAAGSAVSKIAAAWKEIPGPIRESAVQALVFAGILKKIMSAGPIAGVLGARGGRPAPAGAPPAGAPGAVGPGGMPVIIGAPGGGFSQRIGIRDVLDRRRELAAQQAASAQRAAEARARAVAVAAMPAPGPGRWGQLDRRVAIANAETAAARAERGARLAREERALFNRNIARSVMPSGRGVATSSAVAAGSLALSGGDLKTALPTAAIVGAGLAGPWGAAGAVVATAAGAGLVKFFKNKGKEELREALGDVREGPGQNLSDKSQRQLAEAKRKYDKAVANDYVGDGRGGIVPKLRRSAESLKAERDYGRLAGEKQVEETVKGRRIAPSVAIKSFIDQNNKLTPEAKAAAAKPWLAAIAESEAKGRVLAGTTARFARSVGAELPKALQDGLTKTATALRADKRLERAAGDARRTLEKTLKGQEGPGGFQGLAKATDTGWRGIVSTTRTRIAELKAISQDYGGSTAETRAKASAEYHRLQRNLNEYLGDSIPIFKELGSTGRMELASLADAAKKAGKEIGTVGHTLAETVSESMRQLERVADLPKPGDPDFVGPVKPKRRGGLVQRFRGGGWIRGKVSPGEEIVDASGYSLGIVPGARVAADTVEMMLPENGYVLTDDMQARIASGQPFRDAVRDGLPHFQNGGGIGPARAAQAYRSAGFTGTNLVRMTAIAGAESRWRPGAVSPPNSDRWGSRDHGLSQVNDHWHPQYFRQKGRIYEPGYNARAAWAISDRGTNFGPWSTWTSGAWKTYEPQAREAAKRARSDGSSEEFSDKTVRVPMTVGRSKVGRGSLIPGAFSSGFQLGQSGYSYSDLRRFGRPVLGDISGALGSGKYFREVTAKGGGGGTKEDAGGGLDTSGVKPIAGVKAGIGRFGAALLKKFSGLQVTSTTGGNHTADSWHYKGRAIDVGGPAPTRRRAAYWIAGAKSRYRNLIEGIHNPGLSVSDGSKVPQKFWGKDTWDAHDDHLHLAMRRGGLVRRFRTGGKTKPPYQHGGPAGMVGPVNMGALLYKGGADWYEKLGNAADEVAYRRVESTIAKLRKIASAGGDARVVARAQAAMAVLENSLGIRVGQMLGRAQQALDARSHNLQVTQSLQRIRGIDPGSPAGISGQVLVEQRFLNEAPARQRELEVAVKRAERGNLRSKEGRAELDAANEALKQFRLQVLDSRANIAELGRAAEAAARAQVEAGLDRAMQRAGLTDSKADDAAESRKQADYYLSQIYAAGNRGDMETVEDYRLKRDVALKSAGDFELEQRRTDRRAGLDDAQTELALAGLTADPADDLAANRKIEAILAGALESAKADGDKQDIGSLAGELKGVRDAIEAGNAEKDSATQQLADAIKQLADNQAAVARAVQGQDALGIMAGAVSGVIGGNANAQSGYPTPWRP